jgi:hypothetical protein
LRTEAAASADQLIALAAQYAIPAVYHSREFARFFNKIKQLHRSRRPNDGIAA